MRWRRRKAQLEQPKVPVGCGQYLIADGGPVAKCRLTWRHDGPCKFNY